MQLTPEKDHGRSGGAGGVYCGVASGMRSDVQESLKRVLTALCMAGSDVGYCQGMNFIAAILLRIFRDRSDNGEKMAFAAFLRAP